METLLLPVAANLRNTLPNTIAAVIKAFVCLFAIAVVFTAGARAQAPTLSYPSGTNVLAQSQVASLAPAATNVAAPGYSTATVLASLPTGPAVMTKNTAGDIYYLDFDTKTVVKVYLSDGHTETIGSAYSYPVYLSVDANDNIYVMDLNEYGHVIKTHASDGHRENIYLGDFANIAVADKAGNIYFMDYLVLKKRNVSNGSISDLGGTFISVVSMYADQYDNIYVLDNGSQKITQVKPNNSKVTVVTGIAKNVPATVAVDGEGNTYWTNGLYNVVKQDANTTTWNYINIPVNGATGLVVGNNGQVYVGDNAGKKIYRANPSGGFYIDKLLPAGLVFNRATGIISGTPTALSAAKAYNITAYNGSGSAGSTVNISVIATPNALNALTISNGTLSPVFSKGTLNYTATVGSNVDSIRITPTFAETNATAKVNGMQTPNGTASAKVGLATGNNIIPVRVTSADASFSQTYTVTVRRQSTDNYLTGIGTNHGNPVYVFNKDTRYNLFIIPNGVTSVTVAALTSHPNAKIYVGGQLVASGSASPAFAPAVGTNHDIQVVAEDGSSRYYTVIFKYASTNSYLNSLSTTAGAISPVFNKDVLKYSLTVPLNVASTQLTALLADTASRLSLNGGAKGRNINQLNVPLAYGDNVFRLAVTPQEGPDRSYTLTITRPTPSVNANLNKITLSQPSVLTSTTGTANYNYNMVVSGSASTANLTLTSQDANAKIAINGAEGTAGSAITNVAIGTMPVIINAVVTAENGTAVRTYKITVVKAPSANANLSKMVFNQPSALSATTGPANYNYNAVINSSATSATLTITAQDTAASISVNGGPGAKGTNITTVAVSVTAVVTDIEITAADGISKRTYRVNTSKVVSHNANLSKIAVSLPSALSATTGPATYNYNSVVTGTASSGFLRLTAQDATASISINNSAATLGSASAPVTVGATPVVFGIVVTAEDGTTTVTYRVTVSKAAPPVIAAIGNNKTRIDLLQKPELTTDALPEELVVKQAVSPNGDGVNDRFTIAGIGAYPENSVRVMDRNGDVVYEANGYNNESKAFDGHNSKGTLQQAGTYFYSVVYKKGDETLRKTGYIVLKY